MYGGAVAFAAAGNIGGDFEKLLELYGMEDNNNYNWGDPDTLLDHFEDHGADFGAQDSSDYARMANEFYQNRGNYQVKIDKNGNIRVYGSRTKVLP